MRNTSSKVLAVFAAFCFLISPSAVCVVPAMQHRSLAATVPLLAVVIFAAMEGFTGLGSGRVGGQGATL
jgi:hypothetical protein